MSEHLTDWIFTSIRNAAGKDKAAFMDGDWIEAPYITNSGIRLIQTGNVGRGYLLEKSSSQKYISHATFRELRCSWVHSGDILICRLADPIGRACIVPDRLDKSVTSVDVTIMRVNQEQFHPHFILHYLNSDRSLKRAADVAGGSTRSRISRTNLGSLELPAPPLLQQQKIAQILDTLDTQLQKTEALIAKLEKIKEGLLNDLLTRGIDQNGQLRPTPEQAPELYKESALGLIPKEWEVEYLSNLSESGLLNGVFKQPSRVGNGVPLINVADLYKGDHVDLSICERFNASPSERSKYSARRGDIFFTRSSLKLEGIAHCNWLSHDVVDSSVVYECHVIRIRPCLKVDPHFLVSWCQSPYARRHFMANAKQVTMTTISQDGIASLICPVPPLPEQTEAFERVKGLEDRIEKELLALKKIRLEKAGLTDDLLTGRVRVTPLLKDAV